MTEYYGFSREEFIKFSNEVLPMLKAMPQEERKDFLKKNKNIAELLMASIAICKDEAIQKVS